VNRTAFAQDNNSENFSPHSSGILQRKCTSCSSKTIAEDECNECANKGSKLQRKLSIGASNDTLELEADRVADQVMSKSPYFSIATAVPKIRRVSTSAGGPNTSVPVSVNRVLDGSGALMQSALRQDMEQRFSHDFSQVKLHTNEAAVKSTNDINAHAYTVGNNVVFGAGQFAPETDVGRRLLGHELTHVVQQSKQSPILQMQENPTRRQIRRDDFLRRLARNPGDALPRWRRLNTGERAVLVTYMTLFYDSIFASRFREYASRRSHPEQTIHITNTSNPTSEQLRIRGYRLYRTSLQVQFWIHPSGNQVWRIISSPQSEELQQNSEVSPRNEEAFIENPPQIDTNADPVTVYGRSRRRGNANIFGSRGYAVQYADGTIELFEEGTNAPSTYKPRVGGGYDLYDTDGIKVENVILLIDPEQVFSDQN